MEWNKKLIIFLETMGVKHYFGCNGGGLVHIIKHITTKSDKPDFMHYGEYTAGFAPIGHYLATGEIACGVATTGAAQKLISSGISDARFMGVPSIYLLALSSKASHQHYPIQDTSDCGMNIVAQFEAEFKDSVIKVDEKSDMKSLFSQIKSIIERKQPVIIMFYPEVFCQQVPDDYEESFEKNRHAKTLCTKGMNELITTLSDNSTQRRTLVFAGSEASIDRVCPKVFQRFVSKIDAQVIYSVNGDNVAVNTKERNLGHIMLGGNEAAVSAWQSLTKNDILITLGIDVGEYVLNLENVPACHSFCLTSHTTAYGQKDGSYKHVFHDHYHQINGNIQENLEAFLSMTHATKFPSHEKFPHLPDQLKTDEISGQKVDLVAFYRQIDQLWQKHSIVFEDVCIAYRDRQAVIGQPNANARFFTSNHGSAMGSAFGLGVGAAVADQQQKVFIFSGDGCFQLYAGSLHQAAKLNITLFIMNNEELSIVRDGCKTILKESKEKNDHSDIEKVNWKSAASAFGWRFFRVKADLSNLSDIMQASYDKDPTSIIVDLPLDPSQVIGKNFRYANVTKDSNL